MISFVLHVQCFIIDFFLVSLVLWPILKVMQKVFALLLVEFRKLGAAIVFANFSKIIIDTGKSDLYAAKAYCDSLLKTLQTRLVSNFRFLRVVIWSCFYYPFHCNPYSCCRDLFEWIELEPVQFWHSLLFMDQVSTLWVLLYVLVWFVCMFPLHSSYIPVT